MPKRYGKKPVFRKRRVIRRRRPTYRPRRRSAMPMYMPRKPEMKTITTSSSVTAFNQQITASDVLPLFPTVSQGTGGAARIGDKISLHSGSIRGLITMTGGDYTTISNTRIGVRLMIVRMKRFCNWADVQANFSSYYTNLLEGQATGYSGDLASFTAPVNRDLFSVIKDKRYTIDRSHITLTTTAQNLGKSYASFTWKLPYQKRTIQFNGGDSTPQNYPYFMLLGFTKLDGSAADGSTTTYVQLQYTTTFKYTDY